MTERTFDQTAEGWDAASDEYARLFAPFTSLFAEDVVHLYPPRTTDAVLEVAAGSGALTTELSQRASSVLATDLSPRMVARLEETAKARGYSNVTTAVMDAQALALADAAYDVVYSMFGVMFFPDLNKGFQEMARVLKPAGRCVVTSWNTRSRLLAPIAAAMEKLMPGSPPAQALSAPPALGDPAEFKQQFERAGLHEVEVHEVTHALELPSREVYVRQFPRANPNGILMQKMLSPQAVAALAAQIEAELAAEFGDGPIALQGVANIASGVKR